MNRKNIILGLAVAVFFSLVYITGAFDRLGNQVYDYFLGFRAERERSGEVVFLDVDDNAIAYNGVFPWPRSITAEGLLRLKEYGARAAVFDIEYIDKGPPGVDAVYLNRGLPADFSRSFSGINSAVSDIFSAIRSGRFSPSELDDISEDFRDYIGNEREELFTRAQGVVRDNDVYLIQASALFGRSWATLNLREKPLEDAEQASRRPIAEERFSYPVVALPNANPGIYVDILPALPGFALAAAGSGFTNIVIDRDGIRRRIDLAQNIFDHWYLQLTFAPLVNYLGNPEMELGSRKLVMKNAAMPDGATRDITIPLDGKGRMLLDWPRTGYVESYRHISFYEFSLLEDLEAELEYDSRAFGSMDILFFAQFDPSLTRIPFIVRDLSWYFDAISTAKAAALEDCSEDHFRAFVDYRTGLHTLIRDILEIDPGVRVIALAPDLVEVFPEYAEAILYEAEYIAEITGRLALNLDRYEEIRKMIEGAVRDKFCILGRVDTGTTDIGANPFHSEYVNVGTHGVVLDMILSGVFITPIASPWLILFTLVFVVLFFILSEKIPPVWRAVSGFLAAILAFAAPALLFRHTGFFFNPLLTVFSVVTAVILREISSYAGSEREKQFIRKAFSTYVSHEVVKEILADPSRLQLWGTIRRMSAIFTDLQGFSTISERLEPERLVSLLNRYLT
jgi:adenylate cyclase